MLTLALAVLLTFTDPPADLGNGTVRQPTAAVGRPNGALDVTQFELYDSEAVTFSLTFTSLANPFNLPNGFTFPIIEVYLDDQLGTGSAMLLPGSGMRLPRGATWNYAFKLTGETLHVFQGTPNGWQDVTNRYPTRLTLQGTTIIMSSSVPRPEKLELYGMVGSYTGFNETGWTPINRSESPWAYSSPTQIPAALDVIAPTFEAQQDALASGVLPVIRPPRPTNPWIFVMIGGVLVAVLGVMLRFAPGRHRTLAPSYMLTPTVSSSSVPDTAAQDARAKSAHPGPYQPEPLKSRSSALKQIVGDKPLPEAPLLEDANLTPGQVMAAERTRAMIVNDRKLRDTGETPVTHLEGTEAIRLDDMNFETGLETATPHDPITQETQPADISGEIVKPQQTVPETLSPPHLPPLASTALAPTLPIVSTNPVKSANPKAQFAPSQWHDEEDEFAFLWNDSDDAEDLNKLEPKKGQKAES